MNSYNITSGSSAPASMPVVAAVLINHKERLTLEKGILWNAGRAII